MPSKHEIYDEKADARSEDQEHGRLVMWDATGDTGARARTVRQDTLGGITRVVGGLLAGPGTTETAVLREN